MTRSPLYLSQDRHGTYHFRARIPERLRRHFDNKTEIKRSLRTDSRKEAVCLARAYRVELDMKIAELEKGSHSAYVRIIEAKRAIAHDDGTTEVIAAKTVREGITPEESTVPLRKEILEQLREEGRDKIEQRRSAELHKAKLASTTGTAPAPAVSGPLLSEAISRYVEKKNELGHWKGRSSEQVQATLRDFLEVVGDRPLAEVTRQVIEDFAAIYGKLPANRNKKREFRGKPIADILKMKGVEPIDPATLRNNLNRVSSFFKWAKVNQLIVNNPAESVTWVLPKNARQKKKIDARETFTTEELQRLFHAEEFKKPKSPYQYWVPVIGLYSGARIEEICSRELNDIKQDGEVWYFDIKDTKTEAGTRQLPLHPKLIELGLLDYIERLKAKGETRLFPELKPNKYGEHGPRVGKWFARYRQGRGVGDVDGKKCFHSFRHNVVDILKQKGTQPEFIHAIVGHEDKIAHGTYGRRYQATSLKHCIDKVEYSVIIPRMAWK